MFIGKQTKVYLAFLAISSGLALFSALSLSLVGFSAEPVIIQAVDEQEHAMQSLELNMEQANEEEITKVSDIREFKVDESAATPKGQDLKHYQEDTKKLPLMQFSDLQKNHEPAYQPVHELQESSGNVGPVFPVDEKGREIIPEIPVNAVAVFPVVKHGRNKAFGDLPVLFADEFANRMELKSPETRVLNPVYAEEELRSRGFGRTYDRMMDFYIRAGRPEPRALKLILSKLSEGGQPIDRVAFVEADVDYGHMAKNTGIWEKINQRLTDSLPKDMKYIVKSRVKVYSTSDPRHPQIWAFNWSKTVRGDDIGNVTPSVYQDSDSIRAFGEASRAMNRVTLLTAPIVVYQKDRTEIEADVSGKIVGANGQVLNSASRASQPSSVAQKTAQADEDDAAVEDDKKFKMPNIPKLTRKQKEQGKAIVRELLQLQSQ